MLNDFWAISEEQMATAKNHLGEARVAAQVIPGLPDDIQGREVSSVGVVGSGTMGIGIAISLMLAGKDTLLFDTQAEALQRAAKRIGGELDKSLSKGRITEEVRDAAQARLRLCENLTDFADVDMVIEAVFESMSVKQDVFRQLDEICKPGAILGTNTSTLDIDQIAGATKRPQDVIGLHFFSPAHIMPLLEIIRGKDTALDVQATAVAFAPVIRKTGVMVGNCYGFAGNRMVEGFSREANYLLLEGVSPQQVDAALQKFGMAMGPFTTADLVGIDVPYKARQENCQAAPGDDAYYRVANALYDMGRYGQKTGRGYYLYDAETRQPSVDPEIMEIAAKEAAVLGIAQRTDVTDEEIVARCMLPVIAEGAKILEEGIACRASDLDLIYSLGYGFPGVRGGPMHFADTLGLDAVVAQMKAFSEQYDYYWQPCALLEKLASERSSFAGFDQAVAAS